MLSPQAQVLAFERLVGGKETVPLVLVRDLLVQLALPLVEVFAARSTRPVRLVLFETLNKPAWCTEMVDGRRAATLHASPGLTVVDSLDYTLPEEIPELVASLGGPGSTILVVQHTHFQPAPLSIPGSPSTAALLEHISGAVIDVSPTTDLDEGEFQEQTRRYAQLLIGSVSVRSGEYTAEVALRRKSGREQSSTFLFKGNSFTLVPRTSQSTNEPDLVDLLTTFQLSKTAEQEAARAQVELPFTSAQHGINAGAIVYEFERDDDYDEEDPYEDPF